MNNFLNCHSLSNTLANSDVMPVKSISNLVEKTSENPNTFLTKPRLYSDKSKTLFMCSCDFQLPLYHKKLFNDLGVYFPSELLRAVNKRQAEFLAGRYVAQQAMLSSGFLNNQFKSTQAPIIPIGKNRSPIWPTGIQGSITHNNVSALCAVTTATSIHTDYIGIDVESLLTAVTASEIKSTIHTSKESELLISQGMSDNVATTLIFSAKESLFKALYPVIGEYFGFECAKVVEFSLKDAR